MDGVEILSTASSFDGRPCGPAEDEAYWAAGLLNKSVMAAPHPEQ